MSERRRSRGIGIVALAILVLAAGCGRTAPAPEDWPRTILVTNDDGIAAPGSRPWSKPFVPRKR
jgi:hypothetical protein